MAEIRVEQKSSSKWIYIVAALIVAVAVWLLLSRRDDGATGDRALQDTRYQDSVRAASQAPAPTAAVPRDSTIPPR